MTDNLSRLEKKRQTREKIIKQATEIIATDGLKESFIKQVGSSSGVAHGSIFAHFGSKEMLIAATTEGYVLKASNFFLSDVSKSTLEDALESHLKIIDFDEELYTNLIIRKSFLPEKAKLIALQFEMKISAMLISAFKNQNLSFDHIVGSNMWIGLVYRYLENKELYSPNEKVTVKFGDILKDFYLKSVLGGNHE